MKRSVEGIDKKSQRYAKKDTPCEPAQGDAKSLRTERLGGEIRRLNQAKLLALLIFLQVGRERRLRSLRIQLVIVLLGQIVFAEQIRQFLFGHRSKIQAMLVFGNLSLNLFLLRCVIDDLELV